MTSDQIKALRADFLTWSGGFTPREMETEAVDFWITDQADEQAARREIEQWMSEEAAKS